MNAEPSHPRLIALIPAYNESAAIARVVQAACKYLPVLVIDDGSKDDTAAQAMGAGAQVMRQLPNQGKGAALMNGFRHALEQGVDALVMLDADGQHDPDEIPAFLNSYAQTAADLIIGQRDFSKMPQPRRTTNTIGTWLFSWAVGQQVPDNQSGFRLLSRRMLEATLNSRETNFEFEVEMIVRCIQNGYRLSWVPIKTIYGDERSHIQPLRHIYHFSRMILQTRAAVRRKVSS
jgi:glycosyltransferase involved in cell wall biosynthesis